MNKKVIALVVGAAIAATSLAACSEPVSGAQAEGQKQTEQAFSQQSSAVPYPATELRDSLERRNLKERLLRTNKPNQQGFVYLMSFGKIIGYYGVKGKVSSTQSQMTTDQLIIQNCGSCSERSVVNAPGDDGSYGANEEGIFFFTLQGQMITTNLDYIWSDNPISIDVPRLG
jgi:hypothetical protein